MQASSKSVDEFSVYVRNLDQSKPHAELEELLYELFLQAGPLSRVYLPSDRSTGLHKGYGFIEFMHKESLPYAVGLLEGIRLHGRPLIIRPAGSGQQTPSTTPTGRMARTVEDSPGSAGNASFPNPFQRALDDHDSRPPSHHASPHLASADLRSPPVDLLPPPPPMYPYCGPPMESPHRYRPLDSPHGYQPVESQSPHGYPYHHPYPLLPPPPPPPHLHSPPLAPPTPMELERSHHRHHEARLHSRDHPRWLKEDVRDRLSQYHRHELEHPPRRLSHELEHPPRRLSHEGHRNHYH